MNQKKDRMANWVKVERDLEVSRIDSQVRVYNDKIFDLEDQIRVLERKLDKLFDIRGRQKGNIQSFTDMQDRKKQKYKRLQEVSLNTAFIQKQSNKMLNFFEGQRPQGVFHKLEYSLQAIDHEVNDIEIEIQLLKQERAAYQNKIESLYLARRALSI